MFKQWITVEHALVTTLFLLVLLLFLLLFLPIYFFSVYTRSTTLSASYFYSTTQLLFLRLVFLLLYYSYFFLLAPHTVIRRTANEVKMNSSILFSAVSVSVLLYYCFQFPLKVLPSTDCWRARSGQGVAGRGGCCYRSATAMGSGRQRCTCRTARAANNANCMSE